MGYSSAYTFIYLHVKNVDNHRKYTCECYNCIEKNFHLEMKNLLRRNNERNKERKFIPLKKMEKKPKLIYRRTLPI